MTRMSLVTTVACVLIFTSGCQEWEAAMLNAAPQRPQQQADQPQLAQQRVDPHAQSEWEAKRDAYERTTDPAAASAVRDYLADLDAVNNPRTNESKTYQLEPRSAEAKPVPLQLPPRDAQASNRSHSRVAIAVDAATPPEPIAQSNVPVTLHGEPEPLFADTQTQKPKLVSVAITPRHKGERDESTDVATSDAASADVAVSKPALIEQLIAQTESELAGSPSDARLQWRLGLLKLAANQPAQAGNLSPELTEERRGLLARQVAFESALQAVLDGDADGVDRAYAALGALREDLRSDAELALPTLALCNKVTTFGVYNELPDAALTPYQANRAIVYCEIDNLATETDPTGQYRTLLATRLELFTKSGQSRWVHEEQRIEDVSRQRRDDFFIAQLVTFPADLGPGEYVLKATVTDLLASKTNETSRHMVIGGETALTSAVP